MRRGLIDNATLTAVQRLLGKIPVKNKHTLDGDILAFETLLQSILFFDELSYIDNYKEKYKDDRSNFYYYLKPIKFDDDTYQVFENNAQTLCNDIIPEVVAGDITDPTFKPFFDLLKMHNIFTWDMSSSVYYLTQKMLLEPLTSTDIKYYSKLHQMIFNEALNKPNISQKPPVFIDSNGKTIKKGYKVIDKEGVQRETGIKSQVEYFMANLSWLSYRTIFYTLVANSLGGTLVLHPIRSAFQASYLAQMSVISQGVYSRLITQFNTSAESTAKAITSVMQPYTSKYQLPMFSTILTKKAKSPSEAINLAFHWKEEGDFVSARQQLSDLEELFSHENSQKAIQEANKLNLKINSTMLKLCEKYSVTQSQGVSLSPVIHAFNLGANFTELAPIPNINLKTKHLSDLVPQTGFNAVYKSLVNDLAAIGKLGKYHEILTSQVNFEDHANHYDLKTEDETYRRSKSFWKIPM